MSCISSDSLAGTLIKRSIFIPRLVRIAKVEGSQLPGITTITSCTYGIAGNYSSQVLHAHIRVWQDDTCCKRFQIPNPMSNSDSYISNTAANYRYRIFSVVKLLTELVLWYITHFFVVKNMFLSCTTVLSQMSQPAADTFHKCWDLGVIRLQKAEVYQWISVPFKVNMKLHATCFTSVRWGIFK